MLPSTDPEHCPPQPAEQPSHDRPDVIWKQPPFTHWYPLGQFDASQTPNTQPPSTQVAPAAQHAPSQMSAQRPSQQPQPAGQAWPQAAQFAGSEGRLAHTPEQQVCPEGQVPQSSVPPQPSPSVPHWPGWHVCGVQQLPASQTWPRSQVLSQMPQFSGSVWRLVHWSPQQVWPAAQHSPAASQQNAAAQHVAPQHVSPDRQQTEPQHVCPPGQQASPQHDSPAAQCVPFGPQAGPWQTPFCSSQVWPFGQVPQEPPQPSGPHAFPWQSGAHWHRPLRQVDCGPVHAAHAAPPVPQARSVFPGWHVPLLPQHPFGQVEGEQAGWPWH